MSLGDLEVVGGDQDGATASVLVTFGLNPSPAWSGVGTR